MEQPTRYRGKHERRSSEDEILPVGEVGDYEYIANWGTMGIPESRAHAYGQRVMGLQSKVLPERPQVDLSTDNGDWTRPWTAAFMPKNPNGEPTFERRSSGSRSEERLSGSRREKLISKLRVPVSLALLVVHMAVPMGAGGNDFGDGEVSGAEVLSGGKASAESAQASMTTDGVKFQNGMNLEGTEPGEETLVVGMPAEGGGEETAVPPVEELAPYSANYEANGASDEDVKADSVPAETETPEVEAERTAEYDVIGKKIIDGLGAIDKYKYSGGYIRENDPYYVDFGSKSTEDSFGVPLEGATPAERVQSLTRRWAASPKELVAMISHMNLESEMGIAEFKSMDEENAFADELAGYDGKKYDDFVNRFYTLFYGKVAKAKTSKNCVMARDMMDRTGDPSDGDQAEVKMFGQLRGNEGAVQVTFYDENGKNLVSDKEAYNHEFETLSESEQQKARRINIGRTAWINIGEEGGEEGRGGNLEYKAGVKAETPTPSETPDETPTPPAETPTPTQTPPAETPTPTQTPPAETPTPTQTPPAETPTPTVKPTPTPEPPKPTKDPEAVSRPIEEVKVNENVVIDNDPGTNPSDEGPSERPESIGKRTIEEEPASQDDLASDLADLGL